MVSDGINATVRTWYLVAYALVFAALVFGLSYGLAYCINYVEEKAADAGKADGGLEQLRKEAIELGYAEYNSKTGEWQWKKGGQR